MGFLQCLRERLEAADMASFSAHSRVDLLEDKYGGSKMSEEMVPKCGLRTKQWAESQALPKVCLIIICLVSRSLVIHVPMKG